MFHLQLSDIALSPSKLLAGRLPAGWLLAEFAAFAAFVADMFVDRAVYASILLGPVEVNIDRVAVFGKKEAIAVSSETASLEVVYQALVLFEWDYLGMQTTVLEFA
jgi:hypothetical protein